MADDDEIDILGDFSFNSCLAQNNQGIPSCSDREDTVHPQWLQDSTAANWYDKNKVKPGPTRKLSGTSQKRKNNVKHTEWTTAERNLLASEMIKHGRNVKKISQTLKSKTEPEIQALIEAEFGIQLDSPVKDKIKNSEVPHSASNLQMSLEMVKTAAPTVVVPMRPFQRKTSKNSLLKPDLFTNAEKEWTAIKPSEILYEDDLTVGSTVLVGTDLNSTESIEIVAKSIKESKEKAKVSRKYGNHRRKNSRSFDKNLGKNNSKDKQLKSPQGRQRKNSSLSDDTAKSPKLQIVLGSGQALPVSEGEQIIKIEKEKDSESDSEIDIDVNSDNEDNIKSLRTSPKPIIKNEEPIAVPLTKFHPLPKRHKRFNLDGEGGYTIMHTAAGDLVAAVAEPRKERVAKPPPVQLVPCPFYGAEKPAPWKVFLHVSTLILMEAHAHTSRAEVMGLVGGTVSHMDQLLCPSLGQPSDTDELPILTISGYQPAKAAADTTHCDMDPLSQLQCSEALSARGLRLLGWHHSHPAFPALPSRQDLASQAALQRAVPGLALITSPRAPRYCCFRVEEDGSGSPAGFQFRVGLVADLRATAAAGFLRDLRAVLAAPGPLPLRLSRDRCPHTHVTYLEKLTARIRRHLRSAGYEDGDALVEELLQALQDIVS